MEFEMMDAAAIPVISGWIMKAKDFLPKSWCKKGLPFLAILCGLAYSFALRAPCSDVTQTVIIGLTLGLGAIGAHSSAKNAFEQVDGGNPS